MNKITLFGLIVLALVLAACSIGEGTATAPAETVFEATSTPVVQPTKPAPTEIQPEPTSTPTEVTEPTEVPPEPTSAPVEPTPTEEVPAAPSPGGWPPQSNAAEIRPPEMRDELIVLSNLIGFQVTDQNGESLGTVPDYIINTCETYIIYFAQQPGGALDSTPGSRLIIPFEAVTINSGALDAEAQSVVLHLTADQFAGAPSFPESMDLLPTVWEPEVWTFWNTLVRLGVLTTECKVTGSDGNPVVVQKVAYASQLLVAKLQDALQTELGTVKEIILEPESGKMHFFVIDVVDGNGLALVPPGAVNIPDWALEPGNDITLILLAENEMLFNAPRVGSVEDAASGSARQAAWEYWAIYR